MTCGYVGAKHVAFKLVKHILQRYDASVVLEGTFRLWKKGGEAGHFLKKNDSDVMAQGDLKAAILVAPDTVALRHPILLIPPPPPFSPTREAA